MTSKNLFFKLVWQDFKKRIWCPIIIFLIYFLGMELRLFHYLDRIEKYPSDYNYTMKDYLANEFFAPSQNYTMTCLTIVIGVLCALSGYAYLHSKKQLDTYHSMPVKREILFLSRYVSGFIMFLIPAMIHTFASLLLGAAHGAFSVHGVVNAIGFLGVQILCFLLLYSITIIAVCLTGNMIVSILGTCVLAGYSTIISYLSFLMYEKFFYTFAYVSEEELLAFSPIGMIIKLHNYAHEYYDMNGGFSYGSILTYSMVILLAVVVFTLLGLWLYKKRATEAAGKPIAFGIAEPFIKAMVVIPVSIFLGLIIQGFVSSHSFGCFIFGVAFGFFVIALVMEIIFRLDIKCAFCHWKQLVFNGVCVVLIVVIFKYDVLGYNTYVPSDKELSGCAISIEGLMDISLEERMQKNGYRYTSAMDYRFDNMNVIDNPSAMALARKAASGNLQRTVIDYYEGIEETPEYKEILEKEVGYREIVFQYTKKNGKQVYRQYLIDISDEETLGFLSEVFADSDYKLGAFPILTNGWKKEYSYAYCDSNDYSGSVKLSPERQAKLFEVYQSELLDLSLGEVMEEIPLGNIEFQLKGFSMNEYGGNEEGYKIYPSFLATIELLKEYGFDYTKKLTAEQAKEIRVSKYCDDDVLFGDNGDVAIAAQKTYSNEVEINYTDMESKAAILACVVNRELLSGISYYYDMEESEEEIIAYYDDNSVEELGYYCFSKENKPQFIDADMAKKIEEKKQEILAE